VLNIKNRIAGTNIITAVERKGFKCEGPAKYFPLQKKKLNPDHLSSVSTGLT